jgi:hypothetical protein
MIGGARGASPTDVSSVMTSSFVVQIKAFVCRSRSWGRSVWASLSVASGSSSVLSEDGDL